MYVWKTHPVLVLWVGLSSFPIMVVAQGLGDLTPQRPALTAVVPEMVIPEGPHYLTTWEGTTTTRIDLPADFFFPGSDPVDLIVWLVGDPIGPVPRRRDGFKMKFVVLGEPGDDGGDSGAPPSGAPYDTVMGQLQAAVLNGIGDQVTVDLTMQVVHLRGVAPVEVTGAETRFYDVLVEITDQHQGDGRQANIGHMTYTRNGVATGEFTAEVYAWARYIFIPQDGGERIIHDRDEQLTIGTRTPTPFFIPALHQGRVGNELAFCCTLCSDCDLFPEHPDDDTTAGCHCAWP